MNETSSRLQLASVNSSTTMLSQQRLTVPSSQNSTDLNSSNSALTDKVESISNEAAISAGDLHTIDQAWESLDYDICENVNYRLRQQTQTQFSNSTREVVRWFSFGAIGFLTALVAVLLNLFIEKLYEFKLDRLESLLVTLHNQTWSSDPESMVSSPALLPGYLLWIGIGMAYVLIAALATVFIQPAAGGSGVPQLKSYLNGIRVRAFLGVDALLVKTLGTGLSVASGLAVGQEGPMVHCGAIVAAAVAEGTIKMSCCRPKKSKPTNRQRRNSILSGQNSASCCCRVKCRDFSICSYFKNDHDKRDFVSAGGAAGLAAAFGTPITGVLFALEEGASFWNQRLTLGLLLSSMTATFTVFFINTIIATALNTTSKRTTNMLNEGVFSFGNVTDMKFDIFEIPFVVIVGIFGGLFGALFNKLNKKLAKFRFHYLHNKFTLIMEPIFAVAAICTVAFITTFIWVPSCSKSPLDDEDKTLLWPSRSVTHNCGEHSAKARLHCQEGEYATTSLLFLQLPEQAAKTLFVCEDPDQFPWYVLLGFSGLYFLCTCWCCGISVPSGIFVPNFLVGAAWGRLLGVLFYHYHPPIDGEIHPGKYAVFGAAAQMAGVSRMTLTLTCMVAEGTGNVAFGLPVMIVCVIAKFIGELLTEGIYEQYLHILAVPFLSFDPPANTANITVADIASSPVVTLRVVETVSRLLDVVKTTEHSGFPIVDDAAGPGLSGGLTGLLRRDQLLSILVRRQFARPTYDYNNYYADDANDDDDDGDDGGGGDERRAFNGRRLDVSDIVLRPHELSSPIDLRPFMNPAPYAVLDKASLSKVFRLFRGLGLRHLVVVNRRNEVVGIVTRKDLAVWDHGGKAADNNVNNVLPVSSGLDFD